MGKLRDSVDPETISPFSRLGFTDMPKDVNILLDDIAEIIAIKRRTESYPYDETIDYYSYDEYDLFKTAIFHRTKIGTALKRVMLSRIS